MKSSSLWANVVVLAVVFTAVLPGASVPASATTPVANGFQMPVGDGTVRQPKGDGDGWYTSRDFGSGSSGCHGGEDWNADTGYNTDYGEPVRAAAAGTITYAGNPGGGWGKVMLVEHRLPDGRRVATQYAHLATIAQWSGTVARGQKMGTVGTGDGRYVAHLHFELRTDPTIAANIGACSQGLQGWTDPSAFIWSHRRLTADADAPALATDADGRVYMAAMRRDGSLYVRRWTQRAGWSQLWRQGDASAWSVAAGASFVSSGPRTWLVAVSRRGRLYARPFTSAGPGSWRQLGAHTLWSLDAGPVAKARPHGAITVAAVRRDGSLYSMSWRRADGWSAPRRHGSAGLWSSSAAPQLVWDGSRMRLFALTARGTLRAGTVGTDTWRRIGPARSWAVDGGVGAGTAGEGLAVAAVTRDGTLKVARQQEDGTVSAITVNGPQGVWSRQAPPLVVTGVGRPKIVALRQDGSLFGRSFGDSTFVRMGEAGSWSRNAGAGATPRADSTVTMSSVRADGTLYTWSWMGDGDYAAFSQQGSSGGWAR